MRNCVRGGDYLLKNDQAAYSVAVDDEEAGALVVVTFGALVVLIGLFLPLFTVHYAPPGGTGIVYGQRMDAFTQVITGWQFAGTAARWTGMLFVIGLLVLPFCTLGMTMLGFWRIEYLTKPAMALCNIAVTAGLLLLGLAVLQNRLVMPASGRQGMLAAFHLDPLAPDYQQALQRLGLNGSPTAHLYATFGVGWFVLAVGLLLGLLGLWRWVGSLAAVLAALLVVSRILDHPLYDWVSTWFLT
jgi:hypothetical protein